MIPKTITKEHIIEAARSIDSNPVPELRRAKKFEVTVNGRNYPPKYLISIASQMVGRALKPDEFGGGVETNSFLMRLGFVVHRIADLTVASPRRQHRVKIARAWLDMGTSHAEFYPRWKKDKRSAFKKIIEKQFQDDKRKYYKRLWSLSSQAVQKKADILVLPACALMFEKRLNYRKALGDNVPRIVASGKFQVRRRSPADTALILRDWKPICVPPHEVLWTGLDGEPFSIMAAISSTMVKRVVRDGHVRVSDKMKPDEDAPVLLLDMGHQRYTPRYLYQSLRKVWESARQPQKAVVILSSWHYCSAHYECPWTWPLADERGYVTWAKGSPNESGDVIDMIEVDLSRARKPQSKIDQLTNSALSPANILRKNAYTTSRHPGVDKKEVQRPVQSAR